MPDCCLLLWVITIARHGHISRSTLKAKRCSPHRKDPLRPAGTQTRRQLEPLWSGQGNRWRLRTSSRTSLTAGSLPPTATSNDPLNAAIAKPIQDAPADLKSWKYAEQFPLVINHPVFAAIAQSCRNERSRPHPSPAADSPSSRWAALWPV
jgi:hypothetical protein